MGLTSSSVGMGAACCCPDDIVRHSPNDKIIAIAGNPNVGKSTIFNSLTGMKQHTGNWPGKTVSNAHGFCSTDKHSYIAVDIPGTYSLMAHSAEEEVARNFVCFGNYDAVIVVCDATCLERNLNLVLQILEITSKVVVCVNLLDEAKRKGITVDINALSKLLGVPVVGTVARKKKSLDALMKQVDIVVDDNSKSEPMKIRYTRPIEDALSAVQPISDKICSDRLNSRWFSIKLLENDKTLLQALSEFLNFDFLADIKLDSALKTANSILSENSIGVNELKDRLVSCIVLSAEEICIDCVKSDKCCYNNSDRKFDKIFTSKMFGYPIMIAMLAIVFWFTIIGANYPSELLSKGLFKIQNYLTELFNYFNAPHWLHGALVLGVYRVVAWVVSVMLPPMAIFFPFFTILEDSGYLPRVAYNLDYPFKKCSACGKQSLTMCLGFGCNAAGVVGCRIIDSPRERLIAILTNSFVPCNGRFPTLIIMLSIFFVGTTSGFKGTALSAIYLTLFILLGITMTLVISFILSKTILKGTASSFTLELPPYRKPQILKVIAHSVTDRTLFVLGRAVVSAAPAGLIIWIMANVTIGDKTLLLQTSDILDPFARLLGLDGVILLAFILGFPANEIVIPIIIMSYMASGTLIDSDAVSLGELLRNNGWTWTTAVSMMLFSLMHWPCSTTLLTIKKETASIKWTFLAMAIPTVCGITICMLFNMIIHTFA